MNLKTNRYSRVLALLLSASSLVIAQKDQQVKSDIEWADITYYQREDFKLRITNFESPIRSEWGIFKKETNIPDHVVVAGMLIQTSGKTYEQWLALITDSARSRTRLTEEKYERLKQIKPEDHPSRKIVNNFIYSVDYIIDGVEYSIVVSLTDEDLKKVVDNDYSKIPKNRFIGKLLKKENGQWKKHVGSKKIGIFDKRHFAAASYMTRSNMLKLNGEFNYLYLSRETATVELFNPCEELKEDSIEK